MRAVRAVGLAIASKSSLLPLFEVVQAINAPFPSSKMDPDAKMPESPGEKTSRRLMMTESCPLLHQRDVNPEHVASEISEGAVRPCPAEALMAPTETTPALVPTSVEISVVPTETTPAVAPTVLDMTSLDSPAVEMGDNGREDGMVSGDGPKCVICRDMRPETSQSADLEFVAPFLCETQKHFLHYGCARELVDRDQENSKCPQCRKPLDVTWDTHCCFYCCPTPKRKIQVATMSMLLIATTALGVGSELSSNDGSLEGAFVFCWMFTM